MQVAEPPAVTCSRKSWRGKTELREPALADVLKDGGEVSD